MPTKMTYGASQLFCEKSMEIYEILEAWQKT